MSYDIAFELVRKSYEKLRRAMRLISFVLRSCARTTVGSCGAFVCGGALLGKHVKHVRRVHIRKNQ